jgi:hypothetical protein
MNVNELTYGAAEDVASLLGTSNTVTPEDLTAALTNALNRIDTLEKQMKLEQAKHKKPALRH